MTWDENLAAFERSMDARLAAGDTARETMEGMLQARQRDEGAAGCNWAHIHPDMDDVIWCAGTGTWPSADFCRNDCDCWEPPC